MRSHLRFVRSDDTHITARGLVARRTTMYIGTTLAGVIDVVDEGQLRGLIAWVSIETRFRGLGLSLPLYAAGARHGAGYVMQDPHCSPHAQRVWASIRRRWRTLTHTGAWADGRDGIYAVPRRPSARIAQRYP